jgi:hypothetical protein
MGCHTRAPESPRSHFGSGAGGEGQNAHPNASNIAFVHMFCPPLNHFGSGAGGEGQNAHPNASNIAFVHMFCPPLNPPARGQARGDQRSGQAP